MGCRVYVAPDALEAHLEACAYGVLFCCPEPGCVVADFPKGLRDHLDKGHAWPVHRLEDYGVPLLLRASASQPHHRLPFVDSDKRHTFVLSVRPHGEASCTVSVSCARTLAAAEAGARFSCKLCVQASGGVGAQQVIMDYTDVDCGTAGDEGMLAPLCVPFREMDLTVVVRIDTPI